MNAEEARKIWEREVSTKAQVFIEFIKKRILQYTYQNNVFIYAFEFPDFVKSIQATAEQEITDEFIQGIFDKVTSYFKDLGFRVKADNKEHKIWITYSKHRDLEKNTFTDNLINIIKVRNYYRTFTGIDQILSDIQLLIRESARRNRSLKYELNLNIANEKCLLLEDLEEVIENLEKDGFTVFLEGDLYNNGLMDNMEYISKCSDEGLCLEELRVILHIKW